MYVQIPAVLTRITLAGALAIAAGCNLGIDLDRHPYAGRGGTMSVDAAEAGQVDTTDANVPDTVDVPPAPPDVSDGGGDVSDTVDTPEPSKQPRLIFSEVMPDSSTPPDQSHETGEYIEIKNVGQAPADPRRIIIQLAGSNRRIKVDPFPSGQVESQVLDQLAPIHPGGYFVFVRQDTTRHNLTGSLADGTYYEYGRWSEDVPLANAARRLELTYRASEFDRVHQDTVEWASGRLVDPTGQSTATLDVREDVAWGVQPTAEDPTSNDDPLDWCFHTTSPPDSPIKASPGQPTPADCTR